MKNENKKSTKPGDFEIELNGVSYYLPSFEVIEGEGLVHNKDYDKHIVFVRGSKITEEVVPSFIGITHESLMEMMIHDLKYKNSLVPSRETALTITKLEEALLWQQRRGQLRAKEGKQGTYKK
ncbi:MAG: hypothetical protein ABJ387_01455 [Balneola sp.]